MTSGAVDGAAAAPADLHHLLAAACAEERRLWVQVSGRHPGQPGHDPDIWNEWAQAAQRVHAIGRQLRPGVAQRVRGTIPWG